MKKFNEELYKGIKKGGFFEDQYYKYIVIDKNLVFKGWKSNYLNGQKYEFYGILDTTKKDVFTIENTNEIQQEFNNIAITQVLDGIKENYNFYINIQKNNFDEKIKNDDFKKSILYYYMDGYSSNNFNELFIEEIKPDAFKNTLLNKTISINKNMNDEIFLKKYLNESKENIIYEIKENIFAGYYLNNWDFDYNWNNGTPENEKIDFSFNNDISLKLNKIELIINEYEKIYDNPSELLKKCKNLYNKCNNFYKEKENKTIYIYLKDDTKLKILDFAGLINCFKTGKDRIISYRFLTGSEQNTLESYNEKTKNLKRENDLFIEDIKKIEFNKVIIFEEKEES